MGSELTHIRKMWSETQTLCDEIPQSVAIAFDDATDYRFNAGESDPRCPECWRLWHWWQNVDQPDND